MVCVGGRGVAPDEFAWDVFALFFMSVLAVLEMVVWNGEREMGWYL
jgi:hypothetical protein